MVPARARVGGEAVQESVETPLEPAGGRRRVGGLEGDGAEAKASIGKLLLIP